jgi:hypothetical protein
MEASLWRQHCRWSWKSAQSRIIFTTDSIIITTVIAGATLVQDRVPGAISPGITTLKRSGAKAAPMAGAEVQIVTTATGANLNLAVPFYW